MDQAIGTFNPQLIVLNWSSEQNITWLRRKPVGGAYLAQAVPGGKGSIDSIPSLYFASLRIRKDAGLARPSN